MGQQVFCDIFLCKITSSRKTNFRFEKYDNFHLGFHKTLSLEPSTSFFVNQKKFVWENMFRGIS